MLGLGASVAIPAVLSGFENTKSIELDGTGDHVTTYADNSGDLIRILCGNAAGSAGSDSGFTISTWIHSDFADSQVFMGCSVSDLTSIGIAISNTNFSGILRQITASIRYSSVYASGMASLVIAQYDSTGGGLGGNIRNVYDGSTKWVHFAITMEKVGNSHTDYSIFKTFINGTLATTTQSNATPHGQFLNNLGQANGTTSELTMTNVGFILGGGDTSVGASSMAAGKVDETSIWNTHLSNSEITDLYNSGVATDLSAHPKVSRLVNWWRFEGDTTDTQGNQDATAQGNPTFSTTTPS